MSMMCTQGHDHVGMAMVSRGAGGPGPMGLAWWVQGAQGSRGYASPGIPPGHPLPSGLATHQGAQDGLRALHALAPDGRSGPRGTSGMGTKRSWLRFAYSPMSQVRGPCASGQLAPSRASEVRDLRECARAGPVP